MEVLQPDVVAVNLARIYERKCMDTGVFYGYFWVLFSCHGSDFFSYLEIVLNVVLRMSHYCSDGKERL